MGGGPWVASVLAGDGERAREMNQTLGAWHEDQGRSKSGGRHGGVAGGASDTWSCSGAPTATRGAGVARSNAIACQATAAPRSRPARG